MFQNSFSFDILPANNQITQLFKYAYLPMLYVTVSKWVWVVLDSLNSCFYHAFMND